jgi:hypothetical protein
MVLYSAFPSIKKRHQGRKQNMRSLLSHFSFYLQTKYKWLYLACCIILSGVFLASCSGLNFGGANPSSTGKVQKPTPTTMALSKLHWCDKPLMVFRDLAASGTPGTSSGNPTTVTDWTQVRLKLGFVIYLPATLPTGSCLVSASGTVRDPILGSNFVIGYVLPDHSPITLSQAPQRSQSAAFQCSPASDTGGTPPKTGTPKTAPVAADPTQFCSGVRGSTNIVFSSRGKTDTLQQFFNALQPDVDWIPAT